MRRANGSLMLWVVLSFLMLGLLQSPVQGQAELAWIPRHEASSPAELIATLERSQAALLQARQAVDSALLDIDHVLASLRVATPDEVATEGFFSRAATKLDSLSRGLSDALAGGLDRLKEAADTILGDIAVQLEERESSEVSVQESPFSEAEPSAVPATASEPAESSPAPAVAAEEPAPEERPCSETSPAEATDIIHAAAEAPALEAPALESVIPTEVPRLLETSEGVPAGSAPPKHLEEKSECAPPEDPWTVEDAYGGSTSRHWPWGEPTPPPGS